MANLTYSAKSGDTWSPYDLEAFNIKIVREDIQAFFGAAELPAPKDVSIIWNNWKAPPGPIPKVFREFFTYLHDSLWMPQDEGSVTVDFAKLLLKMLDYTDSKRVLHERKEMLFDMCGSTVDAKADVTVIEQQDPVSQFYILLFKEDRSYDADDEPYPEPQLIAAALAAFHQNNKIRQDTGTPPLQSQTFPGITMVGTAATFYKITITSELALAVAGGVYPENETIVREFVPPVSEPLDYVAQGMFYLENRRLLLQCFEAFKQFMV
ncbi:hypothetical protein DFP72DRAFT_1009088 [Ephemerocybe angulata]|uniref:Uncharacterized protein n=1 Tax=Ephemerocybe angulata TaxID=980116 RepID=A0A8H6HZY5_9AGAR|nr:hypothetical protein DFP72DRAFT_1009088 [Tulosesus angulatus]